MSRQSVVFATNRRFDDRFRLLVPVAGSAPVAHANRDLDAAEYIAFVGPLMEGDLPGGRDEISALAKVAKIAVATVRYAAAPDNHRTTLSRRLRGLCEAVHIRREGFGYVRVGLLTRKDRLS
jgi:hypothetical protein